MCVLGKSTFCLKIFFYYAEANNKIMKDRANLPYSFEILSSGQVFRGNDFVLFCQLIFECLVFHTWNHFFYELHRFIVVTLTALTEIFKRYKEATSLFFLYSDGSTLMQCQRKLIKDEEQQHILYLAAVNNLQDRIFS